MMPFRYDMFGLTVASDLAIPWATESTGAGPADVAIILRPPEPAEAAAVGDRAPADGLSFLVPDVAAFRITDGREIVVTPLPGTDEEAVRLYLLGSAIGMLLHQRGLLVLHANAIVVDGGAALFMGASGAGKSTLAAWFVERGLPVLTDDVCAIAISPGGEIAVLPGLARLRLSDEAATRLAVRVEGEERCRSTGKYEIGMAGRRPGRPVPLRACYLLSDQGAEADAHGGDGSAPVFLRLAGLDAVDMLMANTYRGFALHQLGGSAGHLAACMKVAEAAACFEVRRRKDWSQFDSVAEMLLAHAADGGGSFAGNR